MKSPLAGLHTVKQTRQTVTIYSPSLVALTALEVSQTPCPLVGHSKMSPNVVLHIPTVTQYIYNDCHTFSIS